MITKILAGLLMGLVAGAASKVYVSGEGSDSQYFKTSSMVAAASSIAFVFYTFINFSAAFGFAAIGELIVGALISGFLVPSWRIGVAGSWPLILIAAWIMAVA